MMKWYGLFAVLFTLSSCGTPSATNDIAQGAIEQTTAIEQSLPKKCATDSIKTQINAVKTQINAIVQACETEKEVITQEKIRWKWAFGALALVVLVFMARKLMK